MAEGKASEGEEAAPADSEPTTTADAPRDVTLALSPPPRREKQTLIPAFDAESLALASEESPDGPTITTTYDLTSYARIVDERLEHAAPRDTPRTFTVATPALVAGAPAEDDESPDDSTVAIGREMYGSYLSSNYPEALALAERVLELEPEHALAQLVIAGCRDRLGAGSEAPRLSPSSVVRLKCEKHELDRLVVRGELGSDFASQRVLGHVDGIADVALLASLAGIPRPEALDRIHALLDLGVLEVVSA